jgi:hypothetical protein
MGGVRLPCRLGFLSYLVVVTYADSTVPRDGSALNAASSTGLISRLRRRRLWLHGSSSLPQCRRLWLPSHAPSALQEPSLVVAGECSERRDEVFNSRVKRRVLSRVTSTGFVWPSLKTSQVDFKSLLRPCLSSSPGHSRAPAPTPGPRPPIAVSRPLSPGPGPRLSVLGPHLSVLLAKEPSLSAPARGSVVAVSRGTSRPSRGVPHSPPGAFKTSVIRPRPLSTIATQLLDRCVPSKFRLTDYGRRS